MPVALGDVLAKGDAATVQLAFAQEEELGGFFEEEGGGGGGGDNDTATQPDDNQTGTLTNQTTGQTDGNTTQAPMPEFIEICDNDLDNDDDDNLVDLDDPDFLSLVSANQTNLQNNSNNSAPVAYDQLVQATMNTPVDITLFGSDADNNSLTATIDQSPSNGTLSEINQETGVVSYTPKPGFIGQDSFTYKVNDGLTDSINIATVSIIVNGDGQNNNNNPPVAYDQSVVTGVNTPVDITLFGSDADNNSLTATIDQSPSNGTLSEINQETGVVSYTPKPGFIGQDSFTYKVNDGIADSNPATVSITVNGGESGSNIGSSELSTTYNFSEVTFEGNDTWNSGCDKFKLNTSGSFHPISSLLGGPEDFTALVLVLLLLLARHPPLIHSL